jgi:hypothetical protein
VSLEWPVNADAAGAAAASIAVRTERMVRARVVVIATLFA